ncbi:MAG: tripartite tricarboxylate transporter TctB family protein [Aquisalimonadaceae bacterium]
MSGRDYQDVFGGAVMASIGLFCAIYGQRYDFGSLYRMGPGFFPVVLGVSLAALGLMIAVPAWLRSGTMPTIQWRTAAIVVGGTVLFGIMLKSIGMIAATLITAFVYTLADRNISWRGRAAVAVSITVITVLIFVIGLNMNLPLGWWE